MDQPSSKKINNLNRISDRFSLKYANKEIVKSVKLILWLVWLQSAAKEKLETRRYRPYLYKHEVWSNIFV